LFIPGLLLYQDYLRPIDVVQRFLGKAGGSSCELPKVDASKLSWESPVDPIDPMFGENLIQCLGTRDFHASIEHLDRVYKKKSLLTNLRGTM